MTETPLAIHASLADAVLAVMTEVGYVLKTKPKDGGISYSFASEAGVIDALRDSMVRHRLVMIPTKTTLMASADYTSKTGGHMARTLIERTWILRHADSKEEIQVSAIGDGADMGDKGGYKAMTGALKYALRQTFLIKTGDDPDEVPSEAMQRKKQIKRDASFSKAEEAVRGAATREKLLRYRESYLGKGYDRDQVEYLEGIFWTRFNLAEGTEAAPDVLQKPAYQPRKKQEQ